MAVAITQDSGRIRVEWLIRWYARLPSILLLAAGLFFLLASGEIVQQDLSGAGQSGEDWAGLLMCLLFALGFGLPGLVLLTFRYFVELDRIRQQVVTVRQFGPLKFARPRRLTDFKLLSITYDRDADSSVTTYDVNLCGGKGVSPIRLTSFARREEANGFAQELGGAIFLPARDYVGTEPDDDENR